MTTQPVMAWAEFCGDCFVKIWIRTKWNFHWIWSRSRNCGCLVTWFCYQLIAKPGYRTAAVSWPDPYELWWKIFNEIYTVKQLDCCICEVFGVEATVISEVKPQGGLLTIEISVLSVRYSYHEDVMTWECFLHYWPLVRGINWSPVDSHHKRASNMQRSCFVIVCC